MPSRLSSRRAGAVISGEVTEASTETATLSSRRAPPIRCSIPVRSVCHRCATSARSGWPWAAYPISSTASGTPSSPASSSSSRGSAAKPGPATARNSRRASASGSGLQHGEIPPPQPRRAARPPGN